MSIDIVLVHGTTQSPRGWDLLDRALTDRGHSCRSVDLGTVPPNSSSAVFASAVAKQVDAPDPVVVAHSGSGLLLGAISQAVNARHQVFLAAFIPNGRDSMMSELRMYADDMFHPDWLGKDPAADAGVARSFLFHDCDERTAQWALTTVREFVPRSVYDEVVPLDTSTPATVIVPQSDRTIRTGWMERAAADRLGVVATIVAGGLAHTSLARRRLLRSSMRSNDASRRNSNDNEPSRHDWGYCHRGVLKRALLTSSEHATPSTEGRGEQ